jgi:antitoxin CptB
MNNDIKNLKKKLIYRSQYRGTKEMDKLVGSFVENYVHELSHSDLKELEIFLNLDDDIIYKIYNNQSYDLKVSNSVITKLFRKFEYNQ